MIARRARRRNKQQWCIDLAKEFDIAVSTASLFASREEYIQHRMVKAEYHEARMRWNFMEQQWGKKEWKESEKRKARDGSRYRKWLAKCKLEKRPFVLRKRVRNNVNKRLKNKIQKGLSAAGYGTFDTKKTVSHIEAQFKKGMTWDNWGKVWEIDHIVPLAKFDLRNPEHVKRSNHWTNLQPLWKADNRRKGARCAGQLHLMME